MVLRPVGDLERFSTARHNLGIYRCVANTARYLSSASSESLSSFVETALREVISKQPALCCGIINEDKNDPAFVRLDVVDVSKQIEYRELNVATLEEHEKSLATILEQRHSTLWNDIEKQPPWKLIIVQSKVVSAEGSAFDAIFAFHHAIGDGLSGLVFHRSFLAALNTPTSGQPANPLLKVPESMALLPAVENIVNFKLSWYFLLQQLWNEFRPRWLFPDYSPAPWTASHCSASTIQNYRSRVKVLEFPVELVSKILGACREQKATVTGLLHGLIVSSLTTHVPEASHFASATPLSLRHLTGASATKDICVQVAGHGYVYTSQTVSRLRSLKDPEQHTSEIWNIARDFRASMAAEMAALPNDNPIGLIPYVSDLQRFFTSKLGKPREKTYEVSNVGKLTTDPGSEGHWRIVRDVFSQSGMGTGAPLAFNVASVDGGPMCISLTWLYGDIEDRLVEQLAGDVEFGLRCIGEGKEVSLGR